MYSRNRASWACFFCLCFQSRSARNYVAGQLGNSFRWCVVMGTGSSASYFKINSRSLAKDAPKEKDIAAQEGMLFGAAGVVHHQHHVDGIQLEKVHYEVSIGRGVQAHGPDVVLGQRPVLGRGNFQKGSKQLVVELHKVSEGANRFLKSYWSIWSLKEVEMQITKRYLTKNRNVTQKRGEVGKNPSADFQNKICDTIRICNPTVLFFLNNRCV